MSFAGFLFGNINEDGELEDEGILDRSEVMQLSQLGVVGFNDIIDEELAKEDNDKSTDGTGHPTSSKEYSEDYTDINELAEDEEDDSSNRRLYMKGMTYANTSSLATTSADDDYDTEDDKMESEPPLIQSQPSTTHDEAMSTTTTTTTATTTSSSQPMEAMTSSTEGHVADDQHLPTDQLIKKVTELYPSFRQNSILRFSSLIKPNPSSVPSPWKHCNKRQMGIKKEPTYHQVIEISPDTVDDETQLFLTPIATQGEMRKETSNSFIDKDIREWRHGPAKVWYDMMNMPEDGRNISYDLSKMSDNVDGDQVDILQCSDELSEDAFMMVTQQQWENDIIYDMPPHSTGPPIICQGGVWTTADIKPSASSISTPSTTTTAAAATGGSGISNDSINTLPISSFPIENADLIYGKWENDIIFDSNVAGCLLKPALSRLDPNDTDLIIGIPDEPTGSSMDNGLISKDGKKESKKSSKSWNKPVKSENVKFFAKKDPFNLSNDEYYNPNHISSSHGLPGIESGKVVQHSLPALDLYMPWFPTNWSMHALRYFHRPRLKIKATSNDYSTGWQTIVDLNKQIIKKDKEREKERVMSGGGEVFFMRSPVDLSSCDGYLVMAEYSEEHPPLVMACGMATKIKNYYRRPEKLKIGPPVFSLGETTFIQNTSYFLGKLKPGQWVQSFECNLFRAPIYHHVLPDTDFLVVRSDNNYYIRQVNDLFVVGQECPKVEVPAPNSKTVNQFQKDFLQVYLYRLFHESDDKPKKIKMEMVRRAFPTSVMSESVIRKVLKQFADFRREGYESGSWVLRSDVRLPTEEEIRAMVTPEQTCAFYSMLAAEQRLKDAGYGGKSLFAVEEDDGEESSQKIDDEVRAAPWNTTHHFINAMKGKYQLSVCGPADPTGCGEGFSYTRLNTKDSSGSASNISPSKRPKTVMGTDADLRKLKLSKARNVLRNFGVPEEEINKLSRWKVVDLVRTISTEAARSGGAVDVNSLMFARGTRFSQMEAQERYKDECQRVFELQNRVLSSSEVLSTDEETSDSDNDSDDELGRNLESLLSSKKTAMDLTHEQEEIERQELRRLLAEDQPISSKSNSEPQDSERDEDLLSVHSLSNTSGRRLIISRTFRDENSREYIRHEVVKNQGVIDAYIRVMSGSKDKDIRMEFAEKDEKTREDMRKEVKRLQSQIRQLDKAEERAKQKPQKSRKKEFTAMHLTCSACGQKGHMKTNKNCPKYKNQPVQVAPTDAELAAAESEVTLTQDDLVKVEGTKVVLKKDLVEHAEDVRRRSLVLKFPKEKIRKRRRHGDEQLDYLEKKAKAGQRRRTNPEVPFAALLEKIVNKLSGITEFWPFCKPVSAKDVPDYYNVIKFPMDLQTMKDNIRKHKYETREHFREHMNLIVNNCITYNGFTSELTKTAQKLLESCNEEIKQNDKELEQLEHEINPLLGDDPQAAISFLCRKCVERMKTVQSSWPFHFPVSSKKLPDYHMIITRPMDLQTMKKKCELDQYGNRVEFTADINQIVDNSITYNGPTSPFTQTAQTMREVGLQYLQEKAEYFDQYEPLLMSPEASASVQGSNYDVSEQGNSYVLSGEEEEVLSSEVMSMDMTESILLDSGHVPANNSGNTTEIDVEGLDNEEASLLPVKGGMDILREDLQYSSTSSSNEDSDIGDI